MSAPTRSLVCWSDSTSDPLALVCVPFAGKGAAAFRSWSEALKGTATVYGVRLPGRENRFREQPLRDMQRIVDELAEEITRLPHRRVALFGHCSGAIVAFELARALELAPRPTVARLIVASQLPPRTVSAMDRAERRGEQRVIEADIRLTLADEPDLAAMLLPIVEADIEAVATYSYRPSVRLTAGITVCVGADDPSVRVDAVAGWQDETAGDFDVAEIAGADHLFTDGWAQLADRVRITLDRAHDADLSARKLESDTTVG